MPILFLTESVPSPYDNPTRNEIPAPFRHYEESEIFLDDHGGHSITGPDGVVWRLSPEEFYKMHVTPVQGADSNNEFQVFAWTGECKL